MQIDRRKFLLGLLATAAASNALVATAPEGWHQYVFKQEPPRLGTLTFWAKGYGNNALIEDVRVYGRALSSEEIFKLFAVDGKLT